MSKKYGLIFGGALALSPLAAHAQTTVQTVQQFIDSIHVSAHISASGTPYADIAGFITNANATGIKHVRTDTVTAKLADLQQLCNAGFKITLVQTLAQDLNLAIALYASNPSCLEAVEGWNEINNNPGNKYKGVGGVQGALNAQIDIWNYVKANMPGVKVLGPSQAVGSPGQTGGTSFQPYSDYGNAHVAGGQGTPPDNYEGPELSGAKQLNPNLPQVITEVDGFSTTGTGGGAKVDQNMQGFGQMASLLSSSRFGVVYTAPYQFVDSCTNAADSECGYGLFGTTGTNYVRKQAAKFIGIMVSQLSYDWTHGTKTAPLNAPPLGMTITGLQPYQHTLQLRGQGEYYLFVWDEGIGSPHGYWDNSTQAPRTPAPPLNSITLHLTGHAATQFFMQDMTVGSASTSSPDGVNFTFNSGDSHPRLFTIRTPDAP